MKLFAGLALALCAAGPALAADYAAPAPAGADEAAVAEPGYEVRKYYMDTGRAYGAPTTDYAVITPLPPTRFLHIQGARGPARIEIDDRPPFPGPDYIQLIK